MYHKDTVRVGSLLNSSRGLLKGNLAFLGTVHHLPCGKRLISAICATRVAAFVPGNFGALCSVLLNSRRSGDPALRLPTNHVAKT
jgi:hypothetical protein